MFLYIPLTIFVLAALAIAVMVWRKMPQLKELPHASIDARKPLAQQMFPEVYTHVEHVDFRGMWQNTMRETEKVLRWLRLVLGRVVHMSDRLIHRVRQEHLHSKSLEEVVSETHAKQEEKPQVQEVSSIDPRSTLHQREQALVEEIAQNPRNAQLYKEIGDVYAKLKSYNDAKAAFETVLKLNPADTTAQAKLSSVLEKLPEEDSDKA